MKLPRFLLASVFALVQLPARGSEAAPIDLWPGTAPGETVKLPPEADTTTPRDQLIAGRRVIRLGNVSAPTITVYRPEPSRDTGAAVLVCPGGGYYILAMDLEGTEVCTWLNSIGVTAVLLKYRVPGRAGQPRYAAPLQDAQRALGLVRQHAAEWGLDPNRIGVLGFSAGGHLAAALANNFATRNYPAVDAADAVSCRPDFVVMIYPAWLMADGTDGHLLPEVTPHQGATPPVFLAMAEDDPIRVENPVAYYLALKRERVPVEMHLYPTGGHGYGLRRTAARVTTWPDRVADWLATGGWLKAAN